MGWNINGELDEAITLSRDDYERATKITISKKDFVLKLLYENDSVKRLLESNGYKLNKKLFKMPKLGKSI